MREVPLYRARWKLEVTPRRRRSASPLQPVGVCNGSEAGSCLRLTDSCITQLKDQGPSRTCNESKEEEEEVPGEVEVGGDDEEAFQRARLRVHHAREPAPACHIEDNQGQI